MCLKKYSVIISIDMIEWLPLPVRIIVTICSFLIKEIDTYCIERENVFTDICL